MRKLLEVIPIEQITHQKINRQLSGKIMKLDRNYSIVKLQTTSEMIVDDKGLIHGGFIFSLADFAAMVAINHPNVVLGGAKVRFLKPVRQGEVLIAEATLSKIEGKKKVVNVNVKLNDMIVFDGEFDCFITEKHVLDGGD